MARYELLNNITHKDLRVSTRFGTEFGDNLGPTRRWSRSRG